MRIDIRLIVTRQTLCICWDVLFVVFNMLVAPARLFGLVKQLQGMQP